MSNAFRIFKVQLLSTFKLNYYTKNTNRKERTKNILILSVIVYSVIVLGFTSALNYQLMAETLILIDALIFIPILAMLSSVVVSLFTTVIKANGFLFSPRDYDLLAAMPIKSKDILISKMLMLILTNYVFVFITFIPGVIVYAVHAQTNVFYWIASILFLIFIPLIPIVIGSFLSYFVTKISLRFKKNNLALIILMFGLVSLLMVGSFAYTQILVFLVDRSATILDRLRFIYYPAHLLAKSLLENDIFALLAFLSGSLTVFGLFIIAIQKQYRNINARLKESFQSSNYQMESLTPFSMFQAIFKKDVKRYFSSTIYILNTSFGMFLMVIVAIASIFVGTKALEVLVGTDTSEIPIFPILLTMQVAFIAMSCTTSPSISLEGKYLWILKSMPIDPKLIYKSKILLNLTVIIPIHLISVVLLSIAFKLGFIELVLLILVPSAYALAIASGGLLINIIKPSFQWESEVVPVKQSMSVMLAMLWGVFLLAIPIAIYTNVSIENIYIFASLVGLVVLLISMGVLRWINTLGVKKYYEF